MDFRLVTGYTAPAADAVAIALGGPGPQVYRATDLGRPWRPADFHLGSGYTAPSGDAVDLALRELIGDYVVPVVAKPTPDPVDFELSTSYSKPNGDAIAFELDAVDTGPDLGTSSGLDVHVGAPWTKARARNDEQRRLPWSRYRQPESQTRSAYATLRRQPRHHRIPWGKLERRDHAIRSPWGRLVPASARAAIPWAPLEPRDHGRRSPYGRLTARSEAPRTAPWIVPPVKDVRWRTAYDHVDTSGPIRSERTDESVEFTLDRPALDALAWSLSTNYSAPAGDAVDFPFSHDAYKAPIEPPPTPEEYDYLALDEVDFVLRSDYSAPAGDAVDLTISGVFYWPPTNDPPYDSEFVAPPNLRIQPRDGFAATDWTGIMARRDAQDRLPWGPRGRRDKPGISIPYPMEPPEDETAPPPLPASKRVYLLMPSIEAKRVSDNTVVWLNSARIRTDRDSWAWQLDAEPARREDRDAMKPTSSGPVELQVTINGRPWHFLIESHRRTRGHRGSSFTVTGRSPSALLAGPYSAPATRTEDTDRSAQQLAVDELANTGWTLTWNPTDWMVPAGVYSYQGLTPIQSIRRLAEAIGAVVHTAPDTRDLTVDAYYVDSPWNWSNSTLDAVLTEDVILQIDSEWQPGPGYNAIFCAGRQQGVIVHVVRSNTAQDTEAEMVVDDLNTERLAGRERGRQELAKAGDHERVTITTPLLPDPEPPGLLLPGTMVEVQEGGETWPGQVMATDVQATRQNAASVRQTIEVERYHG